MKKVLAMGLCFLVLAGFTFAAGCQKAEEKKVSQAPAGTTAPAPEEKKAEEGKPGSPGELTITGRVSERGDIVAEDGKEYVVAAEDMRKEFTGLVNKKVKATGTVEEREGKTVITVTSYELIGE
jgi:hypothetical protein